MHQKKSKSDEKPLYQVNGNEVIFFAKSGRQFKLGFYTCPENELFVLKFEGCVYKADSGVTSEYSFDEFIPRKYNNAIGPCKLLAHR